MLNKFTLGIILFCMVTILYADEHKTIAFYTKNVARVSEKDVKLAINQVLRTNTIKSNMVFKEEFPTSLDTVINDFISKKYSMITLNVADVLENYNKIIPVSDKIWTLSRNLDKGYSRYLIVVKKGIKVNTFKNKSVAFARFNKMQKYFFESYLLKTFQHDLNYYFKNIKSFDTSSQMLIKLFFSKIDACVVNESGWKIATEMNPQLKNKLQIVAVSKAIFPDVGLTISRKGEKKVSDIYGNLVSKNISIKKINKILIVYKANAVIEYKKKTLKKLYDFYINYLKLKQKYG